MKRAGFTLVEVLVALVVAVAALTLLSQGFMTGARASTMAQSSTRAAILAQRVLTDFETGQLSSSSSQTGTFEDESDFSYETRSETGDVTGLVKLTITVKWEERNQDRTYVLTRLLRERSTTGAGTTTTTPATPSGTTPK
jgi:prepilin-type N-terminal cleavage/methylation domain-containing protein